MIGLGTGVLHQRRTRLPALDVGLSTLERNRDLAGDVLAGGLSFRLFLWMLPFSLVITGVLGFLHSVRQETPENVGRAFGLNAAMIRFVSDAADSSERQRVILLLIGLAFLLGTTLGLLKALRLVHAVCWQVPLRDHPLTAATVVAFTLGLFFLVALNLVVSLAQRTPLFIRMLSTIVWLLLMGGAWLALSWRLPHKKIPLSALVPGTIAFTVGLQIVEWVTAFFLAGHLGRVSELYGTLGVATVLLLWLFLIGRLAVLSATLNALLWERQS